MAHRENVGDAAAEKMRSGSAEKFFGCRTNHDGASVAGEEKEAIFQAGHDGIHIFAKRTEDFVNAAQLLTDLSDFPANLAKFIGATVPTPW